MGDHNVTLVTQHKLAPGDGATLLFERAVVTVGTGLRGAKVTRSIQKSDKLLQYIAIPTSWTIYNFDSYGISHLPWTTLCVPDDAPVSMIIPFSANAILVYGIGWSTILSAFQVSVGPRGPITLSLNPSHPNNSTGRVFFDDLLFFQFNPSGFSRTLAINNYDGEGQISLDYIEIITITGGSPIASQRHTSLIAILSVPLIVVVAAVFLRFLASLFASTPPGTEPAAVEVRKMKGGIIDQEEMMALITEMEISSDVSLGAVGSE
jgi:hypothetical protein